MLVGHQGGNAGGLVYIHIYMYIYVYIRIFCGPGAERSPNPSHEHRYPLGRSDVSCPTAMGSDVLAVEVPPDGRCFFHSVACLLELSN